MAKPSGAGRAAAAGLAVTLLALTALSLVGVTSTRRSAAAVTKSTTLAGAYVRAKEAVAAEESLERKYRLEPGPEVEARHKQASLDLALALDDVRQWGSAEERAGVARLEARHTEYYQSVQRLFRAVDAGDAALELEIDNTETDPAFDRISGDVQAAADVHIVAAARAVRELERVERLVYVATLAGFAVGLCMLAAFGLVILGYQRELVRQSRKSEYQALHDRLTGLPNRTVFADRLGQALSGAARTGEAVAVMVFDLDRFKEVNDALGHHYGDQLLCQVANRVGQAVRAADTVARLGGDEFAVLLPRTDADSAGELAERVLHALHQTFVMDDALTVDVEASIGVVVTSAHGGTVDELMRYADVAMYRAKDGRTGIVVYDPALHVESPTRLALLGDLRRALDREDELVVYYQPKVSLELGELSGMEALVRWQHPTRGLVPPGEFIPVAEGTGLINRLTTHVLRIALVDVRAWLDDGVEVQVAVNLSPRCLLDTTLPERVHGLLEEYGVPAALLRLEVTETAIMANTGLAMTILTELHRLGIRLSVDDYGTGYSSMAYLKRLPVDELKIDRSFVLGMTEDENDAILVRGAIDLGHNLGLTVVAEGVERAEHSAALKLMGCDIAQGFHYARPVPVSQLRAMMLQGRFSVDGAAVPELDGAAVVSQRPGGPLR
ncbi:MAG TPA: EAL domain-containing protein [Micromonosporaceae bacterium]|nr:EAL domain-containing protein [Micromonosporaceae bacterium]